MRATLTGVVALAAVTTATTGLARAGEAAAVGLPASSSLVVNEVMTRGPFGSTDEFVEIRNVSPRPVELDRFEIRLYLANGMYWGFSFPVGTAALEPYGRQGDVLVLTGSAFSGTVPPEVQVLSLSPQVDIPDLGGVAVYTEAGVKVDAVGFSFAVPPAGREGTPASPPPGGPALFSSGRDAVSTDTDRNRTDFSLRDPTPGTPN
ncbi:lamin tail domain-containing protein [Saccharothrix syringae]|uniref:Lamin tail domain-containing protein n=1 Tax=Saccharothrix syringae TaxID=103733 RepID=A0A5Q0GVU7_SACSY|nr:lamin tail domain-containing protein [Saccharothrix syringae]QFZ18138.1 lamin tail domain-containing protein [Saccharothrix syringae]